MTVFPGRDRKGIELDPTRHPELARLGRELRHRLDDTLDAEQAAAEAAARRRRTLRDILITAEDRCDPLTLTATDGRTHCGTVVAVGKDHVEIQNGPVQRVIVAITHIVGIVRE